MLALVLNTRDRLHLRLERPLPTERVAPPALPCCPFYLNSEVLISSYTSGSQDSDAKRSNTSCLVKASGKEPTALNSSRAFVTYGNVSTREGANKAVHPAPVDSCFIETQVRKRTSASD